MSELIHGISAAAFCSIPGHKLYMPKILSCRIYRIIHLLLMRYTFQVHVKTSTVRKFPMLKFALFYACMQYLTFSSGRILCIIIALIFIRLSSSKARNFMRSKIENEFLLWSYCYTCKKSHISCRINRELMLKAKRSRFWCIKKPCEYQRSIVTWNIVEMWLYTSTHNINSI